VKLTTSGEVVGPVRVIVKTPGFAGAGALTSAAVGSLALMLTVGRATVINNNYRKRRRAQSHAVERLWLSGRCRRNNMRFKLIWHGRGFLPRRRGTYKSAKYKPISRNDAMPMQNRH